MVILLFAADQMERCDFQGGEEYFGSDIMGYIGTKDFGVGQH
jgi:hypothetical protein